MALRRQANAFWRFSLRVYREPGVEAACLALQDAAGTDTNVLLWCCWNASQGRALSRRDLRRAMAATRRWQAEVIAPLRQARRALKASSAGLPEGWGKELRRRIGAAELDMEYAEQRLLFELALGLPAPARSVQPREAAQRSLRRCFDLLGVAVTATITRCSDSIVDACLPPDPR